MEFFNELSQLLTGTKKVTIIAQQVGDKITVGFFPEFKSDDLNEKVKMCSITGTPQEMDEGFFAEIRKPIEAASTGLKSNAEEVATEIKAAAEEELEDEKVEKEREEKKAAAKKSALVKKAAPAKKPEAKKEVVTAKNPATPTPPKTTKKKDDPDHNEGTTAEEIIKNASVEEEILKSAQEIISDTVDNDILNPEKQEPENLEIVEDKKDDEPTGTTPEEPSPADKQTAFDEVMSEGAELMKTKDYKTAQSKYELAMELSESNPKNYDSAARKYREATMWVKARERMNS